MKRGFLVRACALIVLAGMLIVPVFTQEVEGAATGYEVGYAKVDVNPWVDLALADGTTIGISASDTSITAADAAKYIVTTTINDPKNPTRTISQKIIAVPLGGYGNAPDRLASSMMDDNGDGKVGYGDGMISSCTTVTDAYGKTVVYVTIDCIRASSGMTRDIRNGIVSAIGADKISANQIMVSASHSHSAPDYAYSSQNTVWKAYYNYVIARIAAAAKTAFDTRSAAEMSKGSIEASDAMNTLGYGDIPLNYVRHRAGTYTLKQKTSSWTTLGTDTIIRTPHSGQDFTKTINDVKYNGSFVMNNEVSEVDETLHVLRFTREEGDPVLLVNWRAHATMNGSSTNPVISSDYVNSLRYQLEQNGYCVGFWQGASGNVNPGRVESESEPWSLLNVNGFGTGEESKAARYGYLLSQVVLTCVNGKTMQDCEEGAISNRQAIFRAERQTDSKGIIAAAKACQAEIDAGTTITYPYSYKYTDNKYYVINSSKHLEQVPVREARTGTIDLELNVMMLGKDVALVTLPVEPFDRYSLDATMSNTTDNDWNDLIGDVYGTPFVLGYSNDSQGYLPNALAYSYAPSKDIFKKFYGVGSYESNTAKTAKGEGEAVIAELGDMLEVLQTGYKTAECEACGTQVQWTPLTGNQLGIDLTNGHYYLAENITAATVLDYYRIGSSDSTETVCLDMNGKTLDYKGQVFRIYSGSALNLMDTGAGGAIIGRTGGIEEGGVIYAEKNSTLKLYGGTLQFIKDASYTGKQVCLGGVICSAGHVYMYGGTMIGGELSKRTSLSAGAVAYLHGSTGRFYMYGGHIQSYTGEMTTGVLGNCVYVSSGYGVSDKDTGGGFNLFNDAVVDELYIEAHAYSAYRNISVSGEYTGSFVLNLAPSISLADVIYVARISSDADISKAKLHLINDATYAFEIGDGSTVGGVKKETSRLYAVRTFAAAVDDKQYVTLTDAIREYTGGTIKLLCNAETVTVNKTIDLLDLNGYAIKNLTVNNGYTVTCMDSQTDDFTITDGFGYGVIKSFTGNVTTIPVEENGYLMLGDDENGDGVADTDVSFHRVDLSLTAISLRPQSEGNASNPGIYYKSNFAGDEVVKQKVKFFGVALSLDKEPNADNMDTTSEYSSFSGTKFQAGNSTAASTLLTNIMQADADNETRATMPIYGRAYIQLYGGVYVFGSSRSMTLKALTESVSDQWDACTDKQKEAVLAMYGTYQDVMNNWNVSNIADAFAES